MKLEWLIIIGLIAYLFYQKKQAVQPVSKVMMPFDLTKIGGLPGGGGCGVTHYMPDGTRVVGVC